ncbi:hypothetical protein RJ55_08036 [Drechmeria coniospora]|nr:hypothetical protein RJ55_08036 [Drechmeria coniospora]
MHGAEGSKLLVAERAAYISIPNFVSNSPKPRAVACGFSTDGRTDGVVAGLVHCPWPVILPFGRCAIDEKAASEWATNVTLLHLNISKTESRLQSGGTDKAVRVSLALCRTIGKILLLAIVACVIVLLPEGGARSLAFLSSDERSIERLKLRHGGPATVSALGGGGIIPTIGLLPSLKKPSSWAAKTVKVGSSEPAGTERPSRVGC